MNSKVWKLRVGREFNFLSFCSEGCPNIACNDSIISNAVPIASCFVTSTSVILANRYVRAFSSNRFTHQGRHSDQTATKAPPQRIKQLSVHVQEWVYIWSVPPSSEHRKSERKFRELTFRSRSSSMAHYSSSSISLLELI